MKAVREAKQPRAAARENNTGRGGAFDLVRKMEDSAVEAAATDEHVYRVIEIVGSSPRSIEGAIEAALGRANSTLRNLRWFEVIRTSGHIEQGKARHYQVTLKVGFTMEAPV
jgi:dodecin